MSEPVKYETDKIAGMPEFFGRWLSVISLVVGLIGSAIGIYAASKALPQDEEIKRLQVESSRIDNALKRAESDIRTAESARKLTLDLYLEVQKVIQSDKKNPREEEAVRVLVESLAEDPFRAKLLSAIALGANSEEVKKRAETSAVFYREESGVPDASARPASAASTTASSPATYETFNVDYFYCESTLQKNQPLAAKGAALHKVSSAGRWRSRLLPETINAQPGYKISDNLVRYNSDERAAAQALVADLKRELQVDVRAMEISYPTPNYLSVFFCAP